MKKLIAGKAAVIEIKQIAEKLARDTGQPCGVCAVCGNDYLTVTEIRLTPTDAVALSHLAVAVQGPNTVILAAGTPFSAEVVLGHHTRFFWVETI